MAFGLSFAPGQPSNQQQRPGGAGGVVSPVQQAIQMLSLRLPRVAGAQALAPGPLLQGPGAMGLGGGGGLEALLRLIMGLRTQPSAGAATLPGPHVFPGLGRGQDGTYPGPAQPGDPARMPYQPRPPQPRDNWPDSFHGGPSPAPALLLPPSGQTRDNWAGAFHGGPTPTPSLNDTWPHPNADPFQGF